MLLLQRFLIRLLTMADHAVRRGGRRLRADPRRARRSDRHDAAARRDRGRHRPAARALRPRQVASSQQFFIWLGRRAAAAISAPRSRCGRTCSGWCWAGCRRRWNSRIVALLIAVALGGAAGDRRRALSAARRSRPASTSPAASALSIPDFLWGLVLILLFGVLVPVLRDFRPRRRRSSTCPSSRSSICSRACCGCASTSPAICSRT